MSDKKHTSFRLWLRKLNPWHYKKLFEEWHREAARLKCENSYMATNIEDLKELCDKRNATIKNQLDEIANLKAEHEKTVSALALTVNEEEEAYNALFDIKRVVDGLNPKIRLGAINEIRGILSSVLSDHGEHFSGVIEKCEEPAVMPELKAAEDAAEKFFASVDAMKK